MCNEALRNQLAKDASLTATSGEHTFYSLWRQVMNARTVFIVTILGLVAVGHIVAQAKKPLTNDDVLQMVKAGFQDSMIVKAIEANDTNFDVSVQALMDLKNAGVSQPIIEAMLAPETKKKAPEAVTKPAKEPPPDPN